MPELECIGGPLDGQTYQRLKDSFGLERPVLLPDGFGRELMGNYEVAYEPSPRTGIRRHVWKWRPA